METGQLPTKRKGLRAAMVDNVIHVTGGYYDGNYLTSILSWNPSTEAWREVGDLGVARFGHAAVEVPYTIIESECSAMSSTTRSTSTEAPTPPTTSSTMQEHLRTCVNCE